MAQANVLSLNMLSTTISLEPHRLDQLVNLVDALSVYDGVDDVRRHFFGDVIGLLEVDFGASFVWSRAAKGGDDCVLHQITEAHIHEYQRYYHQRDPHTVKMRETKRAVLAAEVMPYEELYKTEFYQGFLAPIGMQTGLNLFLFDGDVDLGDYRLWRAKDSKPFDASDRALLEALSQPLRRAILRQQTAYHGLTPREGEVARLVARGCRDQDIARILGISLPTVRTHLNRAMEKQNCANRAELAVHISRRHH